MAAWIGWIETTVLFSPFVDQSSPNLLGMYGSDVIAVCNAVFRSTISYSSPPGDIRDQVTMIEVVRKRAEIWIFLGQQIFFWGGRDHKFFTQFLQRVSIACYAKRCTSYRKSVRLSVHHTPALCQNDSSYDHGVFTVGYTVV